MRIEIKMTKKEIKCNYEMNLTIELLFMTADIRFYKDLFTVTVV